MGATVYALKKLKALEHLRFLSEPGASQPSGVDSSWGETANTFSSSYMSSFERPNTMERPRTAESLPIRTVETLPGRMPMESVPGRMPASSRGDAPAGVMQVDMADVEVEALANPAEWQADSAVVQRVAVQVTRMNLESRESRSRTPLTSFPCYREYLINALPNLVSLDGISISAEERALASRLMMSKFESVPYGRRVRPNVQRVLAARELGAHGRGYRGEGGTKVALGGSSDGRVVPNVAFSRDAEASLQGLSPYATCAVLCPARYKPRQFEYHPNVEHLMVIGTREGHTYIVNHDTNRVLGHVHSPQGSRSVVLGLAWLRTDDKKFVAGQDNGALHLHDIDDVKAKKPALVQYSRFSQLTSVSVNSNDSLVLSSGHTRNARIFDLKNGIVVHEFKGIHEEHINVSKFSNHSPHLFATSSFDATVKMWDIRSPNEPVFTTRSEGGNVMVIFSPDDMYLLSSAIDNEVKQFRTSDGSLHTAFDIPKRDSSHNYTRSYYCNNRDYVITGCCEENIVRLYSSSNGRQLCDVELSSESNLFVQSLRGDPHRGFHMSVLVAFNHPAAPSELFKVNLLDRNNHLTPGPQS